MDSKNNLIMINIHSSMYSLRGILTADSGEELYKMDRDELREVCGIKDGIRIFSHLQRDRAQVKIDLCCDTYHLYRLLGKLDLLTVKVNLK